MKFKIGELVKWYETYGDVYITKATGCGTIVNSFRENFSNFNSITYGVLTVQGILIFEETHLEKI
tara:strand:- start:77 stop:271 length:195 start_codon:yes stop_codon:yes gene_type:complete